MKILLTGSNGLLGSYFFYFATKNDLIIDGFDRDNFFNTTLCELTDRISNYDLVIHAAANTNVEYCELNPDECYRDNLLFTENLARASAIAVVPFVFISSTGVYGKNKIGPYREYDVVDPTTHHHRSKYMAENIVLGLSPKNLVIRTGWLFGGDPDSSKNFVARRIEEASFAAQSPLQAIRSNDEQFGVPCYARDIVQRILMLIEGKCYGVYNCVNSGKANRYEYVSAIVELSGINVSVIPSSAAVFNRIASVSNNEMADNWRMKVLGFLPMPSWQDSLAYYIKNELPLWRSK